MTIQEAEKIRDKFYCTPHPSEEEFFEYTEAMDFLIREKKSPVDMTDLGGIYDNMRIFDLALKYYEMAACYDHMPAISALGYIWYYGRLEEYDYEKAYKYFSKAAVLGDIRSEYKIADMYKNGYYVEKNYEKYKEIIKDLYPKIKEAFYLDDPLPEIFTRLAKIYAEEGKVEDAVELYLDAKGFLAQRIVYNNFFGHFNIMKWLIDDLYELIDFDYNSFDFYDMYYLLKKPVKIRFRYNKKNYYITSAEEDGECAIQFEGKWYRTRDDFFQKAEIDGKPVTAVYDEFYMFEVIK